MSTFFSCCEYCWSLLPPVSTTAGKVLFATMYLLLLASQVSLVVRNLPANAGDVRALGSIPGLGRSPGGGHGNPLWYSCLENPMDRGAWWATVHRVTQSQTTLKQVSIAQYVCWYIRRTLYQTFYLPPWHHLTLLIPSPSQKTLVQRCSKSMFCGPMSVGKLLPICNEIKTATKNNRNFYSNLTEWFLSSESNNKVCILNVC